MPNVLLAIAGGITGQKERKGKKITFPFTRDDFLPHRSHHIWFNLFILLLNFEGVSEKNSRTGPRTPTQQESCALETIPLAPSDIE